MGTLFCATITPQSYDKTHMEGVLDHTWQCLGLNVCFWALESFMELLVVEAGFATCIPTTLTPVQFSVCVCFFFLQHILDSSEDLTVTLLWGSKKQTFVSKCRCF